MASNNITKQEALSELWILSKRKPSLQMRILDKLKNEYGVTVDEFNEYDSTMTSKLHLGELEERAEKLADIEGFSQVDHMSDSEILRIFEARDELDAKLLDIGRPPTEAEWYKAGLDAEQKIERLRPFYEVKKAEEWEQLEYPLDPIAPLMGPLGALTEVVSGALDFRHDFKEDLHERGAFTSLNPLTGFGAWDIAEFKTNPETGDRGFSPELLRMEEELENLYGAKREYQSQMNEGGYREAYGINEEMAALNQIIMENKLLDPRLMGENQ